MRKYQVKVLRTKKIAQNIYKLLVEKPGGYIFIPGQFTEISISGDEQESYKKHFSFTGLNNANYLEFIIKPCASNDTIAKKIIRLKRNEKLIITKPQGNLHYKGMGTFIAGGIGITPFISIFRELKKKNNLAGNKLIFTNKTINDVILNDELAQTFGNSYKRLFTAERYQNYYYGRIDSNFLRMEIIDFAQYFYVSGSTEFVEEIVNILKGFGVKEDSIINERSITTKPFNIGEVSYV